MTYEYECKLLINPSHHTIIIIILVCDGESLRKDQWRYACQYGTDTRARSVRQGGQRSSICGKLQIRLLEIHSIGGMTALSFFRLHTIIYFVNSVSDVC